MNNPDDNLIPPQWLPFTRGFVFVLFLGALGIAASLATTRYQQLQQICYEATCPPLILSEKEISPLESANLSLETYAGIQVGFNLLGISFFAAMAGFLIWRRSDTWMGTVAAFALAYFSMIGLFGVLESVSPIFRLLIVFTEIISWLSMFLLLYIFPSGYFSPAWTRRIFLGSLLTFASFLPLTLVVPFQEWGTLELIYSVLVLLLVSVGVYAQIFRYRRVSNHLQRQQTKWIVAGFSVWALDVLIWMLTQEIFPLPNGPIRLWFNIFGAGFLMTIGLLILPISMVIAILNYRLWDIDLIIRRTLIYGALTGTLAMIYFGSVILLQRLLPVQTQLATILSTLAIAALFSPLRARIQRDIDRLFYRRKYDVEQTLAAFNATVREEVDLDRLSASLLTIVDETMQPKGTALWLRSTPGHRGTSNRQQHRDS